MSDIEKIKNALKAAEKHHKEANVLKNKAERKEQKGKKDEEKACEIFNSSISLEQIRLLCKAVDDAGYDNEKEEMHSLLEKRQKSEVELGDVKKFLFLNQRYGEDLDYNKSFIDRVFDNMEN